MASKWHKFVVAFIDNNGYKTVLGGLKVTAKIALFGFLIGVVIGIIVALVKIAARRSKVASGFSVIGDVYVGFFRGTPIVVQLLIGHFVLFPLIGLKVDSVLEAKLIFGMNSGAYVSEIMRSGVLSVDIGQTEAGRAIGLGYGTTMRRIVLPQAFKNSLPALGNELIALTKDTSVASFIALVDLTQSFRLLASGTYEFIIPYLILALIYLVIVIAMTIIIKLIERRLRKSDRQH
ncbi:MAG: amino acid ABC transporter permease [Clostridia bacterium]|nr:amino acid ABC transporter permease [Clostridia bacterium]